MLGIIAVGVDGSPGSDRALEWAVREATIRRAALRIVHAYQTPPALPGTPPPAGREVRADAIQVVDDAIDRVGVPSAVILERELVPVPQGNAARALIDGSKDTDMLVVGSRGLGGFMGLLVGSVSQHCVTHALCPVVVVPSVEA